MTPIALVLIYVGVILAVFIGVVWIMLWATQRKRLLRVAIVMAENHRECAAIRKEQAVSWVWGELRHRYGKNPPITHWRCGVPAFSIVLDGRRILASGDLSRWDRQTLETFFSRLASGAYIVEAAQLVIVPDAVTTWISAVVRFLSEQYRLDYAPSQLAANIELDDRYTHPMSFFADAFDPARESDRADVEALYGQERP